MLVDLISEDDIHTLIRSPQICVGSDGNCVAPYGITGQGRPHPRFYGTFPRILGHYCQDLHLVDLPRAIWKMTGALARALGFTDRGLLKQGYAADATMFDPPSSPSSPPMTTRINIPPARRRPYWSTAP